MDFVDGVFCLEFVIGFVRLLDDWPPMGRKCPIHDKIWKF